MIVFAEKMEYVLAAKILANAANANALKIVGVKRTENVLAKKANVHAKNR